MKITLKERDRKRDSRTMKRDLLNDFLGSLAVTWLQLTHYLLLRAGATWVRGRSVLSALVLPRPQKHDC